MDELNGDEKNFLDKQNTGRISINFLGECIAAARLLNNHPATAWDVFEMHQHCKKLAWTYLTGRAPV